MPGAGAAPSSSLHTLACTVRRSSSTVKASWSGGTRSSVSRIRRTLVGASFFERLSDETMQRLLRLYARSRK